MNTYQLADEAWHKVSRAVRGQSPSDLDRAVRDALAVDRHLRSLALRDPVERALANPEVRLWIAGAAKLFSGQAGTLTDAERGLMQRTLGKTALETGAGLGAGSVPEPVAQEIFNLVLQFGAFRTLGVTPIPSGKTKLPIATGNPDAEFFIPGANQGGQITEDTGLLGEHAAVECVEVASLVPVAWAWAEDTNLDPARVLLERMAQGLAARVDHAAFMADGTEDEQDGGQTGLFAEATVPVTVAGDANKTVGDLERADFVRAIAGVAPAALQRPCRWWISPALMPALLGLTDGTERILKAPEAADDEWRICGFPVTWTAVAPATDAANQPVAVFGHGAAYAVAVREDFELTTSHLGAAAFASLRRLFRCVGRVKCVIRDAAAFTILKTAA